MTCVRLRLCPLSGFISTSISHAGHLTPWPLTTQSLVSFYWLWMRSRVLWVWRRDMIVSACHQPLQNIHIWHLDTLWLSFSSVFAEILKLLDPYKQRRLNEQETSQIKHRYKIFYRARYYIFLASDWLIISNLGLWLATDCQPEYHCNISLVFTRPASHCTDTLATTLLPEAQPPRSYTVYSQSVPVSKSGTFFGGHCLGCIQRTKECLYSIKKVVSTLYLHCFLGCI